MRMLNTVLLSLIVVSAVVAGEPEAPPAAKPADTPAVLAPPKDPATPPAPAAEGDKPVPVVPATEKEPSPDIHAATKGGDLELVRKMIEADAKLLNARTLLDDTPLHWATSCNC